MTQEPQPVSSRKPQLIQEHQLFRDSGFLTIHDIAKLLTGPCVNHNIDVDTFIELSEEIKQQIDNAYTDFFTCMQLRSARFKIVYEHLDKFDVKELYKQIQLNPNLNDQDLAKILEPALLIARSIHLGDRRWVSHKNYNHQLFNMIRGWQNELPETNEEILDDLRPFCLN